MISLVLFGDYKFSTSTILGLDLINDLVDKKGNFLFRKANINIMREKIRNKIGVTNSKPIRFT